MDVSLQDGFGETGGTDQTGWDNDGVESVLRSGKQVSWNAGPG